MELKLDDNGLLGESVEKCSGEFKEKHRQLLDRCEQLNRDVHSLLSSIKLHTKDGREVITACLLMRAVEFYQAAILLLEKGWQSLRRLQIGDRRIERAESARLSITMLSFCEMSA